MVAVAIIGSAVVGGVATSIGSSKAAGAQRDAANQGNALQQGMYNQTRGDLAPFRQAGEDYTKQLGDAMPGLNTQFPNFSMTQDNLEQTPGYQFNLSQGLKSVNNATGARGLLNSGAVLKGSAEYVTGLADSTYQNQFANHVTQFNMDQTQKQNVYNRLMGGAQLGENAAAQTGAFGTQTAANQAQNTIGAGNASAAASMATANAFANGAQGIGNYYAARGLLQGGGNALSHSMYGYTGRP